MFHNHVIMPSGYIQERFRSCKLRKWQDRLSKRLLTDLALGDDRHIIMVIDEDHQYQGKKFIQGWLKCHHDAIIIPATVKKTPKRMMNFLYSNPSVKEMKSSVILMDIPKITSPKDWRTFSQGLRAIKQGFLHSYNYKWKKTINPPIICCFGTKMPPEEITKNDAFIVWSEDQTSQ